MDKHEFTGQPDVQLWRNLDFLTEENDLEKCVLKLCWAHMIKPRQIECSGFFPQTCKKIIYVPEPNFGKRNVRTIYSAKTSESRDLRVNIEVLHV